MHYTIKLIAHLIIYSPALIAAIYGITEFPDTTQRDKMPLWVALLIIIIATALVAAVMYLFSM